MSRFIYECLHASLTISQFTLKRNHISMYVFMYVCMYFCVHVPMSVSISACMHVSSVSCIMYVCRHVFMYECMCVSNLSKHL